MSRPSIFSKEKYGAPIGYMNVRAIDIAAGKTASVAKHENMKKEAMKKEAFPCEACFKD